MDRCVLIINTFHRLLKFLDKLFSLYEASQVYSLGNFILHLNTLNINKLTPTNSTTIMYNSYD